MVKSAYTEETELNPADFTGIAGQGASAWANVLGQTSNQFAQIGEQKAQADAAIEGMKEGLKGTEAQPVDNTTAANRMFNSKLMTTAVSTMTNQASEAALTFFNDATKDGFTNESFHNFGQQFGAYGAKAEAPMHPQMKPIFKQIMMGIKSRYDTQISKHALAQSLQVQKYNDLSSNHKLMTNVFNQITDGGSDKSITDGILLAQESNVNSSYPSSTKEASREYLIKGVGVSLGIKKVNDITARIRSMGSSDYKGDARDLSILQKELYGLTDPNKARKVVNEWRDKHPFLKDARIDAQVETLISQAHTGIKQLASINEDSQIQLTKVQDINARKEIPSSKDVARLTNAMTGMSGRQKSRAQDQLDLTSKKQQLFISRSLNSPQWGQIVQKAKNNEFSPVVNRGILLYNTELGQNIQEDPMKVTQGAAPLRQIKTDYLEQNNPKNKATVSALMGDMYSDDYLINRSTLLGAMNGGARIENQANEQEALLQSKMGTSPSNIKNQTIKQGRSYANYLAPLNMGAKVAHLHKNYMTGLSPTSTMNLLGGSGASNDVIAASFIGSNHNESARQVESDNYEAFDDLSSTMKSEYPESQKAIDGDIYLNPFLASLRKSMPDKFFAPFEKVIKSDLYHSVIKKDIKEGWVSKEVSLEDINANITGLLRQHGLDPIHLMTGESGTEVNLVVPQKLSSPITPNSPVNFDEFSFREGVPVFTPTQKTLNDYHRPVQFKTNPLGWKDEVLNGGWRNEGFGQMSYYTASGVPLYLNTKDQFGHYLKYTKDVLTVQMAGAYVRHQENLKNAK